MLVPSGFFALRTPLLPLDVLLRWGEAAGEDRAALRERLRRLVAEPEVREALLVSSPALLASEEAWLAAPESERGGKVEAALVRYVARMAGRATPYGLLAATSVGTLGPRSRLRLPPRSSCRRHVRPDLDALSRIAAALRADPALRQELRFRPTSSLYQCGGRLRYAEAREGRSGREYQLVSVEPTPYLESTLERARSGRTLPELAAPLAMDGVALGAVHRRQTDAFFAQEVVEYRVWN